MGCDNPRVFQGFTIFWLAVAVIAVCMSFAGHLYSAEASVGEEDTGMPLMVSGAALLTTAATWISVHQWVFKKQYEKKSIYDRLSNDKITNAKAELQEIMNKHKRAKQDGNKLVLPNDHEKELDAFWKKTVEDKRVNDDFMYTLAIATIIVFLIASALLVANMVTTVMNRDGPCQVGGTSTKIFLLIAPALVGLGQVVNTYFFMTKFKPHEINAGERLTAFQDRLNTEMQEKQNSSAFKPSDASNDEDDDDQEDHDNTDTSGRGADYESSTNTSSRNHLHVAERLDELSRRSEPKPVAPLSSENNDFRSSTV